MPIDFKKDLNPDQFKAATFTGGPLLILAGAGSGKTRTLIYRAAYLLEQGADPGSILLLTFTNKAAQEMQHRLQKLIGTTLPFAGTFHRFCAKFLRTEGRHVGVPPNYLIYDDADQLDLIKAIIKDLDLSPKEFAPRAILSQIGKAKNELITPKSYTQIARGYFQEHVARIYKIYQSRLFDAGALDFDDLLLKTLSVLLDNEGVRQKYQHKYQFVLVDEYQDTNKAQYLIAKTIAQQHQNITAVGDASQSIYRWRGADYRNLEYLKNDFPSLTTVKLERNYRSTGYILDAAHAVIQNNRSHPVLKLWTEASLGQPLSLFEAADEKEEAEFIINSASSHHQQTSVILYRTNAQSRVFEEVCIRSSIPYILVGGVKFYERKEVKDVLAYLRLLINPADPVSLGRVQKLGKRRLQNFLSATPKLDLKTTPTSELFDQVLALTDYLARFDRNNEADLARIENINELRSVSTQFESLTDFLENVALVENNVQEQAHLSRPLTLDRQKPLTLMTIHAAKGLEFDHVYLAGLEEGLFPHSRSLLQPQELEEERRLCYVALTRARTKLYLTYARSRLYFGGRNTGIVSRFISEIPDHLINPTNPYSLSSAKRTLLSDSALDQFLNDEIDIDDLLS